MLNNVVDKTPPCDTLIFVLLDDSLFYFFRNVLRETKRLAGLQHGNEDINDNKRKYVPKKFKSWSQTRKLKELKKERKQKRHKRKICIKDQVGLYDFF